MDKMKNSLFILVLLEIVLISGQTCSTGCPTNQVLRFVSDTSNTVVGPAQPNGGQAVLCDFIHTAWIKNYGAAKWISDEPRVTVTPAADNNRYFSKVINLPCVPTQAVAGISADNAFWTFINGVAVPECFDATERNFGVIRTCNLNGYFTAGTNLIQWRVRNFPQNNANWSTNPTGIIYTLNITV